MFRLSFTTDNAQFDGDPPRQIARILRELADTLDATGARGGAGGIRDENGNTIGEWSWTRD